MADNRRTPPRGSRPRGRTGPGRPGSRGARPAAGSAGDLRRPSEAATRRPRPTSRLAVLALVLIVLGVSYASSMRAYLQQRDHISGLKAQIAQRQSEIATLEREKRRWHDPAYVKSQARERFGYLMPGETSYVVLDEDGKPLESQSELTDPSTVARRTPTAWWSTAWHSVELAGNPPGTQPPPASKIEQPQGAKQGD